MSEDVDRLSRRVEKLESAIDWLESRLRFLEARAGAAYGAAAGVPAVPAAPAVPGAPAVPPVPVGPAGGPSSAGPRGTAGRRPSPFRLPAFPQLSGELEVVIGTSWLNRLGIIAIIFAVAYFLKYSFDNQWIGPAGRVALTLLLGLALLTGGERSARRRLGVFAQGLTGGGIAVLYFAAYAAFAIYRLVGWAPSFLFMVLITVAAALLAVRHDAVAIAMLGLVAGFATPLLLSGGPPGDDGTAAPASAGLYAYLLLLGAAAYVLAERKKWRMLGIVTVAAAFLVPVIVAQGGRPNPGAGLAYFVVIAAALIVLSARVGTVDLAWAALVGGFAIPLMAGVAPVFTRVPYLEMGYFGVITLATLFVAVRHNWPAVATAAFAAGAILGGLWTPAESDRAAMATATYLVVLSGAMLAGNLRREWRRLPLHAYIITALVATPVLVFTSDDAAMLRIAGAAGIFVLYTLVLAATSAQQTEPKLLTVLLAAAVFAGQVASILGSGARDAMAVGAVILAAYHLGLARLLLRRVPILTVLLCLGLALTFVTIAIPLKLHGEAITLAWAVETAMLAWATRRTWNTWAAGATVAVATAMVWRLLIVETPRIDAAGLLATLPGLAFASGIAALGVAARMLREFAWPTERDRHLSWILGAASAALGLYWIGWEIDGAFSRSAGLAATAGAKQVALSAWFTLYGVALLIVGIWRSLPTVRWAGILLIGVTIVKVFAMDLAAVAVVFRVLSLGILGVLLLLASLAYTRARTRLTGGSARGSAS